MKIIQLIKVNYWLLTRKIAKILNLGVRSVRLIISALVSNYFFNIIFFPLLGYSMLINYMAVNDFFSYEIVSESLFAVNIFIMTMVAGLMLTMFAVFGSIIFMFSHIVSKENKIAPLSTYWPLLILNLFFGFLVIYPIINTEEKTFPLFVLAISAYLAVHYTLFLFGTARTKVLSLGALLLLSIGGTFYKQELSSRVFENGLRAFGVGGSISMTLYDDVTPKGSKVKVLLITPKAVYFKQDNATGLIPIDKVKKLVQVPEI
ncbi:hypothetical protein CGG86_20085 [Vibrio parahaemolyticus]|nr:hypothetical protein CGI96_15310 [Vibrio parahaemolyticus]TOQ89802.1 hypothetical protein CGG86_20085 [Vibrio parahaemolyticus]TOR25218.1 hypothetical protein CGG77_24210 [Vibrio parahaemolyticus]